MQPRGCPATTASLTDLRSRVNGFGWRRVRRARGGAGGERLEARKAEERSFLWWPDASGESGWLILVDAESLLFPNSCYPDQTPRILITENDPQHLLPGVNHDNNPHPSASTTSHCSSSSSSPPSAVSRQSSHTRRPQYLPRWISVNGFFFSHTSQIKRFISSPFKKVLLWVCHRGNLHVVVAQHLTGAAR